MDAHSRPAASRFHHFVHFARFAGTKNQARPALPSHSEGRVPRVPFLIFWISSVRFPASDLGSAFAFRACLETTRGAVFVEKAGWQARRRRISLVDLRLRSNEARRPFPRKPSGRRVFCPWPALARSLQPAAGMLGTRRLGHSQNPSPQRPS